MPSSNLAVWPPLIHLAWELRPRRILDVGPGRGKAGILLREYIGEPPVECIDAVEAEPSYVTPRLRALYDDVYTADVLDVPDTFFRFYDLVLMADVIEHLPKEAGRQLLDHIPGWVIVCTPEEFFHNPAHLPESERHRSLWSVADFGDRLEHDASQLGAVLVRLRPLP